MGLKWQSEKFNRRVQQTNFIIGCIKHSEKINQATFAWDKPGQMRLNEHYNLVIQLLLYTFI